MVFRPQRSVRGAPTRGWHDRRPDPAQVAPMDSWPDLSPSWSSPGWSESRYVANDQSRDPAGGRPMPLPTEPIGSIPRPKYLLDDMSSAESVERALAETIERLAATGSPVLTDGEQSKPSFATYPLQGITSLAPDGAVIPF